MLNAGLINKCFRCENVAERKFCSKECYWLSKVGTKNWWGYKIGNSLRGKPKSKEHARKVADAIRGKKRLDITGDNHPFWKGDKANYGTLHDWVQKWKGLAPYCAHCKVVGYKKNGKWNVHWANVSKKYKRNLEDWIGLCRKCHYEFDRK